MKHSFIIRFVMWLTRNMDAFIILRASDGSCSMRANFTGNELKNAFKDEFEKDAIFRNVMLSATADYLSRFPEERNKFAQKIYEHD